MSEWARPDDVDADLDVFATGTTVLLAPAEPGEPSAVADIVRRGGDTLRDYHARPGYRPGQKIATTSGRRSGPTDIVRPVLVDPRRACALALSGLLFANPIAGLELDDDHRSAPARDDRRYLVWHAHLSGDHVTDVPVVVNLLASPSMVVTVIELVPQRRLRWKREGFVRDGVAIIELVAHQLLRLDTANTAG